jgi:hypothetical protein
MTVFGVVFAIAFFACLAALAHFTRRKVIEEPLEKARARRSPVAAFVDDLQRHRWPVIIVLAVLVAVDKSYRFSGGLLQSTLVLVALITVVFAGRLLLRAKRNPPEQGG